MGENMMNIHIANAPCSWGTLEFAGLSGERITYQQMLDELRDTGYVGSELGDWGFMPTEPATLQEELTKRELTMVGAFVPVALKYPAQHADGEAHALQVAQLLAAVAEHGERAQAPLLILADANGTEPIRTLNAGRVTTEIGLNQHEWE